MHKTYRYKKKIQMTFGEADFIIGDTYKYSLGRDPEEPENGGFVDMYGDLHYMPHPSVERDPVDGWATSDYFEEVTDV